MAEPLDLSEFGEPVAKPTGKLDLSEFGQRLGDAPAREDDGPGDFMRGFVTTTRQQNPDLVAAALEGMSHRAPDILKGGMVESAAKMREWAKTSPEEYKPKYEGLVDSILSGDFIDYTQQQLGSGIGSMLPSAVMGAGTAAIGHRVAGKPGALVGGAVGAFTPSFLQNYGEVYQALIDAGVEPARAGDVSWMAAPIVAGLDTVTPAGLIAKLGVGGAKREVARRFAHRFVEEGVKVGIREGGTEGAQAMTTDAAVSLETGKPYWTAKNVESWAEEAFAGVVTGVAVGGGAGIKKDKVTPESNTPPVTPPDPLVTAALGIEPITVEQNTEASGGGGGGEPLTTVNAPIAPIAPKGTKFKKTLEPTTPQAVAPQDGAGTTGNPASPPENVEIGNPNSAPTRSATTAPKTKKGKGKAKAEEIAAKAAVPVSAEHSLAINSRAAPKPQALPQVDDGAAEMAKRFAPVVPPAPTATPEVQTPLVNPVNDPVNASAPIDTPVAEPVTVAAPLATPEEAITPVEEIESGTPEPVGVSAPLDLAEFGEPVTPAVTLPTAATKPGTGPKGRRVLLDTSKNEEGKTKKQIAAAQERSALNANFTDKTAGPKGTRHDSKAIKAAKVAGRTAAQKLMDDNKPSEAEAAWADKDPAKANTARQAIFQRVEKFLAAVPDVVKKDVLKGDPETFPAPEVMVREALDFTKALKERDPKLHRDIFLRYLDREHRLRNGDVASVIRDRRDEGDQHKKGQQKGVEQVAAPTGDVSIESRAEAEAAPEPTAIPDQVAEPTPAPEEEGAETAVARPAPENIAATKEQEDTFEGRGTKVARSIKTFDEESKERIAKSAKVLSPEEKAKIAAEMGLPVAGEVTPKGKAKAEEVKAKKEKVDWDAVAEHHTALAERAEAELSPEHRTAREESRVLEEKENGPAPKSKAAPIIERVKKRKLAKPPQNPGRPTRWLDPTKRNWNTNEERKWLAKAADPMQEISTPWTGRRTIANHSTTLRATFENMFGPLMNTKYGTKMSRGRRAQFDKIMSVLNKTVGDIPIHFVDQKDLDHLLDNPEGKHSGGFYEPTYHYIAISDELIDNPELANDGQLLDVVVHEAIHAATFHALKNPKHEQLVNAVMNEMIANFGFHQRQDGSSAMNMYGFTNPDEFLAEANSSAEFQNFLASKPISKELARLLEMDHWKNATMWDAWVTLVRKLLGFNDPSVHTALEAAISLTERILYDAQPRLANEATEFYNKMDVSRREASKLGAKKIMEIRNRRRAEQMKLNLEPAPAALRPPEARLPDMLDVRGSASAFESFRKRLWVQVITLDQMRQQFSDSVFGGSLKKLTDAMANQTPTIQAFKDAYAPLSQKFIDYSKANPAEANTFARIALAVRAIDGWVVDGVAPDKINEHPKNTHLGKRARRGWQPHALLPGLQHEYNTKLSDEGRALFQEMAQFYADTHNRLAEESIRAWLQPEVANLNPATLNGVIQRTLNQTLTDADEKLLGPTLFHALDKEASFHKVKGMYFPEMRYGNHVVVTRDKITDTMGGTLEGNDEDGYDTVVFKAKSIAAADKLARAFVEKSDLKHLSTETRYFDATTGKQIKADDATGLNDVEYGSAVTMQIKGVHMFESHREAVRFIEENPDGYDDFLTKTPEDRLGKGYQAHLLTGTQMAAILSSVNKRLEGENNEAQRTLVRTILQQAASRMQSGNRIAHRRLKSKHVSGASTDFARNLFNYGDAAARHVATAKAMPRIRAAMDEMRDQLKGYYGKDRGDLTRVFNEVTQRIENGTIEPNEASPLIKNALAISFFARLASPAYSIINSLQVITVAAPILNGRFGVRRGSTAIANAYEDVGLGENLLAGLINTARATGGWNKAGLDKMWNFAKNGRDHLAKLDDGADLVRMFDTLVEGNAISTEAGFEIGSAVAEGKGFVGTNIAKIDRIVRQMPQTVEYINRTVTAVASYRLARESGMNHDKATQFAFDTVKTTQGDYSNANAPRFFNSPWLRPAMQFRKYAQMISYIMLDAVNRTVTGSKEERTVAAKQLAQIFATQIAVAGAFSLPGLEFVKVALMITAAMGLTDSWDDYEDEMRDWADETFGKTWGEIVTSGGTRYFNIDVTGRMSMADLWTFGGPRKNESESVQAYMFRQFIGSPGSLMVEFGEGMAKVADGDFRGGAEKIIPFKAVSDIVKAANRTSDGKGDLTDAALKVVGFRSGNQAERDRKTSRDIRAGQKEQAMGKALGNEYRNAISLGAQAVVRAKIIAFNKAAKNYKNRVPYKRLDELRGKDYSKAVD